MSRRTKYVVACGFVVVFGLLGLGWVVVARGFSARAEPSFAEAFIARRIRNLAIPHAARELTNPVAASAENLSEGMAHFADHCASCHANDGSGSSEVGRGLYPKPPDMKARPTQDLSDGELYYIIENGVRFTGMPAYGDGSESNEDSWKLVQFIRHLPSISDEELEKMRGMNPRTPEQMRKEEEIQRFLRGEDDPPATESSKAHGH